MITENSTMYTEAIFSPDRTHRYLLRKGWDDKKPMATIIMTNAGSADVRTIDFTTMYILNNTAKLDTFGGIDIVNMDSRITTKLDTKEGITITPENMKQILQSAENAATVILAFGRLAENNKKVRTAQNNLIEALRPFKDKLHMIADETGSSGYHPLAPQIRFSWKLAEYTLPERVAEKTESKIEYITNKVEIEATKETTDKKAKKSDKKNTPCDSAKDSNDRNDDNKNDDNGNKVTEKPA